MSDLVGQQLASYRITRLLGRGGFANVYLGEHIYLETQAAIKVLQSRMIENDLPAFLKEAQMIAALKHGHIVRVMDFGMEGVHPFLVMDYAPQGTLRQRHPQGSVLPLNVILPYVKQIAAALHYAHNQELIHRDIKPENILLKSNSNVLVSDFGLAVTLYGASLEAEQRISGTACYMAPEQFKAKAVPASDQYSLAVTVYEWLAGTPPFAEGNFIQLGFQHTYEPVPSLRKKNPVITAEVEQVVLKALTKDPKERYATIIDFAEALEQASKLVTIKSAAVPQVKQSPQLPTAFSPPAVPNSPRTYKLNTTIDSTSIVSSLIFDADNQTLISGGMDSTIKIWNTQSNQLAATLSGHTKLVYSFALTSDGKTLFSGSADGTIKAWSLHTRALLYTLQGHTDGISSLAITNDSSTLVSGSWDNTARLWDLRTRQPGLIITGHTKKIFAVSITPDDQFLLTGSEDKTIKVWYLHSGQLLRTLLAHDDVVRSMAVNDDGTVFASGSHDKTIKVWDIKTGTLLHTLRGHREVNPIAINPDGKILATGSWDKTIKVWNLHTGQLITTLSGHTGTVSSIAFSPDGRVLASGSVDKTIKLWTIM